MCWFRGYDAGMDLEAAAVGQRYRVTWDDCCAQGSFEAVLEAKNSHIDPVDHEQMLDSLTFANGVTVSGYGVHLAEAVA